MSVAGIVDPGRSWRVSGRSRPVVACQRRVPPGRRVSAAWITDPGYRIGARLIAGDKARPEFGKASFLDRPAGSLHKVEIEMQVMDTEQTQAQDFLCFEKMANISARITATRFTGAAFFHRPGLRCEFGVSQIQCARGGESRGVPRQARGQDAI